MAVSQAQLFGGELVALGPRHGDRGRRRRAEHREGGGVHFHIARRHLGIPRRLRPRHYLTLRQHHRLAPEGPCSLEHIRGCPGRAEGHLDEAGAVPDIFAFGPNGFQAPLKITKVAAGHYRGRLPIGENQGLFRVRPLADSRAFPEVGFYRQEDEMQEFGNNEPLLRQIAAATGGRFNPSPRDVFEASGRSIRSSMELWPGLLALALLLNLAELVLRKWKGLMERCICARKWHRRLLSRRQK